mgnify:CR=1 FL=1
MTSRLEQGNGVILRSEFDADTVGRFLVAAGKLAVAGATVYQRYDGTEMRLAVARVQGGFIDIQAQSGGSTKQLFVTVVDGGQAYEVQFNHVKDGLSPVVNIDRFAKGNLEPGRRGRLEEKYPRGLSSIDFPDPGTPGDLIRITEIIEGAELDPKLLVRVVAHDTASGQHARERPERRSLIGILVEAVRRLGTGG